VIRRTPAGKRCAAIYAAMGRVQSPASSSISSVARLPAPSPSARWIRRGRARLLRRLGGRELHLHPDPRRGARVHRRLRGRARTSVPRGGAVGMPRGVRVRVRVHGPLRGLRRAHRLRAARGGPAAADGTCHELPRAAGRARPAASGRRPACRPAVPAMTPTAPERQRQPGRDARVLACAPKQRSWGVAAGMLAPCRSGLRSDLNAPCPRTAGELIRRCRCRRPRLRSDGPRRR
jgi:hypothetical protein